MYNQKLYREEDSKHLIIPDPNIYSDGMPVSKLI